MGRGGGKCEVDRNGKEEDTGNMNGKLLEQTSFNTHSISHNRYSRM